MGKIIRKVEWLETHEAKAFSTDSVCRMRGPDNPRKIELFSKAKNSLVVVEKNAGCMFSEGISYDNSTANGALYRLAEMVLILARQTL